jgi:hypothetical protein
MTTLLHETVLPFVLVGRADVAKLSFSFFTLFYLCPYENE